MIDLGIFMGEYVILRRSLIRWEMDQGGGREPASLKSKGYQRPCLAGFPRQWTNDVLESGYGCIADSREASKIGYDRGSHPPNAVVQAVKFALYLARLPEGLDPIVFGDTSNEQL